MFHVPAHKQQDQAKQPGQVPMPAPQPRILVAGDPFTAQAQPTIGQRITARKQATQAAVDDALSYARRCGYSCVAAGGAFVHLYTYEQEFIDGVHQLSPALNVLHHSRVRTFIDNQH